MGLSKETANNLKYFWTVIKNDLGLDPKEDIRRLARRFVITTTEKEAEGRGRRKSEIYPQLGSDICEELNWNDVWEKTGEEFFMSLSGDMNGIAEKLETALQEIKDKRFDDHIKDDGGKRALLYNCALINSYPYWRDDWDTFKKHYPNRITEIKYFEKVVDSYKELLEKSHFIPNDRQNESLNQLESLLERASGELEELVSWHIPHFPLDDYHLSIPVKSLPWKQLPDHELLNWLIGAWEYYSGIPRSEARDIIKTLLNLLLPEKAWGKDGIYQQTNPARGSSKERRKTRYEMFEHLTQLPAQKYNSPAFQDAIDSIYSELQTLLNL